MSNFINIDRKKQLEQIEQAADALIEHKLTMYEDTTLAPDPFAQEEYWDALSNALYGEDDPRVKELKDGS